MLKHDFNIRCASYSSDYLFIHVHDLVKIKDRITIGIVEDSLTNIILVNKESLKEMIEKLQEVYNEVYGE